MIAHKKRNGKNQTIIDKDKPISTKEQKKSRELLPDLIESRTFTKVVLHHILTLGLYGGRIVDHRTCQNGGLQFHRDPPDNCRSNVCQFLNHFLSILLLNRNYAKLPQKYLTSNFFLFFMQYFFHAKTLTFTSGHDFMDGQRSLNYYFQFFICIFAR